MVSDILKILAASTTGSREAMRHEGRMYGLYRGVVADNQPSDPGQIAQRCIKALIPDLGPTNTGWLQRCNLSPFADPPLPPIGSTVLIGFIGGNTHDGVWLGVLTNLRNPPFDQSSPIADNSQTIPGDSMTATLGNSYASTIGNAENEIQGNYDSIVDGNESRRTEGDVDIAGAKSMRLHNDAGCELLHDEDGSLRHCDRLGAGLFAQNGIMALVDFFGNQVMLGGKGSVVGRQIVATPGDYASSRFTTDFTIDMGGHALHIVNASDVTVNGKSVLVIDSIDTGGDVNADRGY
ncbi:MAG: hypothetical protein ACRC62_01395 [Microcoleus sp.]